MKNTHYMQDFTCTSLYLVISYFIHKILFQSAQVFTETCQKVGPPCGVNISGNGTVIKINSDR